MQLLGCKENGHTGHTAQVHLMNLLIFRERTSWKSAEKYCKELGMDLPSIISYEDLNRILDIRRLNRNNRDVVFITKV